MLFYGLVKIVTDDKYIILGGVSLNTILFLKENDSLVVLIHLH